MDSVIITIGIPLVLMVMMFGLGLDLTVDDFRDVWRRPRAALVVLALQLLVLPVICFGLIELFQLEPLLAVGMMLVANAPRAPAPLGHADRRGPTGDRRPRRAT